VKEGSIVWADGVLDTASIICSYQWLRYDKKNNNAGAVICAVNNHEKDYSTVAEPNITTD
ncbi:hypothetical protein MT378_20705, partial [Psychrobacter sp. 16-Bac2893]